MPLHYVILHHHGIDLPHCDALFETAEGSPLAGWRLDRWPPADRDRATPLPDHRRIYLDYEGPISGNRGHVRRIAAGTCLVQLNSPDRLIIQLDGALRLALPKSSPGPLKIEL